MASSRDRQRKLAREKLDRQKQRRAQRERRRRRVIAGVSASLAVVLIVAGAGWLGGLFDSSPKKTAASDVCLWTPADTKANPSLKNVGTPPTKGLPTSGTRPLTITTNQGAPITVGLDLTKAPCGSASLAFLAQKKFFDNTECTEITAEGALRCGDVTGNGQGGPGYSVYGENLPTAPAPSASAAPPAGTPPTYPKGTVAFIGNPPGTNGSQFLLFFKDYTTPNPQYAIVGSVTGGADTLTKISKVPTVDNGSGAKVKPTDKIIMQSVTAGDASGAAAVAPTASAQS